MDSNFVRCLMFVLLAVLALSSCGEDRESAEDAYERGYEDGWTDACSDIRRHSYRIYQAIC